MICAEIDGNGITSRSELHDVLTVELNLPDWYGRNLDALMDCLTEPGDEIMLTIWNWEELEEKLGSYARSLRDVLTEVARTGNRLTFRTP